MRRVWERHQPLCSGTVRRHPAGRGTWRSFGTSSPAREGSRSLCPSRLSTWRPRCTSKVRSISFWRGFLVARYLYRYSSAHLCWIVRLPGLQRLASFLTVVCHFQLAMFRDPASLSLGDSVIGIQAMLRTPWSTWWYPFWCKMEEHKQFSRSCTLPLVVLNSTAPKLLVLSPALKHVPVTIDVQDLIHVSLFYRRRCPLQRSWVSGEVTMSCNMCC